MTSNFSAGRVSPIPTLPLPGFIASGAANPLPPGLDDCIQALVFAAPIPTHLLLVPLVPDLIKTIACGCAESSGNPLGSSTISILLVKAVVPPSAIPIRPADVMRSYSSAFCLYVI